MIVADLTPGDVVALPILGQPTTFVGSLTPHPLYPGLTLVVWRLPDGHPAGQWSHDALDPQQYVGEVVSTPAERRQNLRRALLDRSQW